MAETVNNDTGVTEAKEMSPVEKAIAAAKAAETNNANTAVAAASDNATGTAVAAAGIPGKKMTMADLMVGSMSVDGWLKVNEDGLKVGDGALITEGIRFYIDFTEGTGYFPKSSIKAGNPAQYWSTFDGVTCASGGSWADATAKARSIDSKAREYRAADIILVVKEDISGKKGKDTVVYAQAGQKLGHTTSTTNWANFEKLYREILKQGLENKLVEVEITSEQRTGNGNTWGVLAFEIIGEATQEETGE